MRKISGICALFAILLAALPAKADIVLAVGDNTLPTFSSFTATFTPTSNGTLTIEVEDAWGISTVSYNGSNIAMIQDGDACKKFPSMYPIGEVTAGKTITLVSDPMGAFNAGCYVDFTPSGGPAPTPEPWTFASVSPAEGEVESLTAPITLSFPDGIGGLDEDWNAYGIEGGAIVGTLTTPSGSESITFNHDFNVTGVQIYSFSDFTAEKTEPGTYTLSFAEGIATAVKTGAKNAAMTYTWTIPAPADETICEFGEVTTSTTDNKAISVTFDDITMIDILDDSNVTIDGINASCGYGTGLNEVVVTAASALTAGIHTIIIPAGSLDGDGDENAKDIKIVFTITGSDPTPGGNGTSEVFFEAGDLDGIVASYGNVEGISGEGVDMTTESFYNTMVAETLWPSYNINSEKELNWKNGTKLIFTSKTDVITSIVFTPTSSSTSFLPYATADKGDYTNGVWTGSLAAGETVTLTANDGINIAKITINYNGGAGEGGDDDDDDDEPSVEIISPAEGDVINQIGYATNFIHVKTNTQFAQFYWMVINDDDPNNMLSSYYDAGTYAIAAGDDITWEIVPPAEKAWPFYKGETYKVVVYAYMNPWDSMDNIAAADSIYITGNGIEREKLSTIELVSIDPTPRTSVDGIDAVPDTLSCTADATISVEFSGAVSTLSAVIPGGASGTNTTLTTAKADATGTKWTITIPADQMTGVEAYPYDFTFNITAKDASGLYLDLDPSHSDHTLDITFSITNTSSEEPGGDDDDPSGDDEPDYGTVVGSATTEFGAATVSTKDNTIFYVTFKDQQGVFGGTGATIDGNDATASKDGIDDTVMNVLVVAADAAVEAGDHTLTFAAYSLYDWDFGSNAAAVTIPFTIAGGSSEDPDDDEPTSKIIVLFEAGVTPSTEIVQDINITKDGVTLNLHGKNAYTLTGIDGSKGGVISASKYITFTFTSDKYNIEKIDFEGNAGSVTSPTSGNIDAYDWTGSAKTYTFVPTDVNLVITKITVYLEGWDDAEETTVPFTMTSAGWGTLILPFEAEIPTGLTAYSTSSYDDSDILTLSEATSLEANTPYIMAGTAGSYEFKGVATNTQSSYTNGLLTGVFADTDINSGYVMQMQGDDVAFYLVNTTVTVPAYHCYISAKSSSTIFRFGDVTAIENALQTISSEPIYDLSGRQVEGALKQGIYIQGGKKFFVK